MRRVGWKDQVLLLCHSRCRRKERFSRNECRGYFGGILPEESKREIIARNNSNGGDSVDVFPHALAIMHTLQYRTENAGALLGDWPRIPLPGTAELLARSAGLGRRLTVKLLDAESKVKLGKEWSFLAALRIPGGPWSAEHLRLTAGWGAGGRGAR